MGKPGRLHEAIDRLYPGKDHDDVMDRLMAQYNSPELVARHLDVYRNAVLNWIDDRYTYVPGRWVKISEANRVAC